eukprot:CAMPEP_0202457790 /NCGR_PEP_ID=MMETSP1360-20130828/14710_1 /ASSEMBLY_ACC=CAM_ASM_000848 /TAXON_ID=515479 /ORGANISM="Licmophora paradoxa, Strain CCMP2313" /LENGTH=68 /DNA_ID=CAMNT_0049077955 /DNA_START=57 /DNA_END=263 /DNA_ORIENTATION=-
MAEQTSTPRQKKEKSFCGSILLAVLAVFIPPLAVGLEEGCNGHLWLNIVLTLIVFVPGVIHALYIIFR